MSSETALMVALKVNGSRTPIIAILLFKLNGLNWLWIVIWWALCNAPPSSLSADPARSVSWLGGQPSRIWAADRAQLGEMIAPPPTWTPLRRSERMCGKSWILASAPLLMKVSGTGGLAVTARITREITRITREHIFIIELKRSRWWIKLVEPNCWRFRGTLRQPLSLNFGSGWKWNAKITRDFLIL